MIIISVGTRPPIPAPYLLPLTCPKCGTVFQLGAGDIAINVNDPTGGLWMMTENPLGGGGITGLCPFCQSRIAFRASDLQ
jgi:hypothetical protein